MAEIPEALVEKAAQALCVNAERRADHDITQRERDTARKIARAVLAAVWDDLPAAQPIPIPRWDEDKVVLTHGWDTPERCGKCGEVNTRLAAQVRADERRKVAEEIAVDFESTRNGVQMLQVSVSPPAWAAFISRDDAARIAREAARSEEASDDA